MNPKVDAFLAGLEKWQKELTTLRGIMLDCGLTEELKWGIPVYTYNKKNVVAIGGFKENCVVSFFKGALLSDSSAILTRVSENTAGVRLVRFTNVRDIVRLQSTLAAYIYEAVEIERSGVKMDFADRAPVAVPEELQAKFKKMPAFKKAFHTLTPGRQRGYLMYFNDARQSKTRTARIEKNIPRILKGLGLTDLP